MANKTGILLINIGTPDGPTPEAVKEFLAEFLNDPLVVDYPRWFWKPILENIILKVRPAKSAQLYKKIWGEKGSPLLWISRSIAKNIENNLPNIPVSIGMSYGNPTIENALSEIQEMGVDNLLIFPLFPQNSSTTSQTAFEKTARIIADDFVFNSVEIIEKYYDHPAYFEALAKSVKESWENTGMPEKLIFSFHGIPQRLISKKGEKYQEECEKTATLTAEKIGLSKDQYIISYQSRFGPEKWLSPYTDKVLQSLPSQGIKNVQIICPGFAADCLETLEEISIQYKEVFIEAGGVGYHYIPALNDSPSHITALTKIISGHLN